MTTASRRTAAAGLTLGLLLGAIGCASSDSPDPEPGGTSATSNSQLDAAGVEQIKESGRARFDLRDHELTPADVGIPEDRMGPIVGRPGDDPVELTLVGPDGEETVSTSTFGATFLTTGKAATSITWFESYDTEDEAFAALDAATDRWGPTREAIDNWRQTLALGGDQKVSLRPSVGPSGLVNQVTVRGEAGGGQTHQWAVLLDPRYYEPDALEKIRTSGELPAGG